MPRKRKTSSQPIGAELLQANFVVNNTTKIFHTSAVDKILDEAMPLLRAKNGVQADVLFRKALTLEPVQPDLLNNLAQQGKSIIMISSELPEILRMSHRVIVMCEGRITGELNIAEATQEKIMQYATQRGEVLLVDEPAPTSTPSGDA